MVFMDTTTKKKENNNIINIIIIIIIMMCMYDDDSRCSIKVYILIVLFSFIIIILTCFNFSWSYWIVFFQFIIELEFQFWYKRTQTHTIQRFHNMDIIRIRVGWVFHFRVLAGYHIMDMHICLFLMIDWLIDLFIWTFPISFIGYPHFCVVFLFGCFFNDFNDFSDFIIYLFCVTYNLPTYLQVN
jgi:hypothetical protein